MARSDFPIDIERFRLTDKHMAEMAAALERKLLSMTTQQKESFFAAEEERFKAEEADAWREALSDEVCGKA
jgi:hypothetical protein